MNKCINFYGFLQYLFDDKKQAKQAAAIIKALLEAQSPRLTNISEEMMGNSSSNYKVIQRFLKRVDMKKLLMRLYQEDAEFIIGDPTEMERYKAPKTPYVGTLSDGKTAGYWLMVLSTPFRGRSLPLNQTIRDIKPESVLARLVGSISKPGVKGLQSMIETHAFGNFVPLNAKYLILGSFTGRQAVKGSPAFDDSYDWFYGTKRNQFWLILEEVYGIKLRDKLSKQEL